MRWWSTHHSRSIMIAAQGTYNGLKWVLLIHMMLHQEHLSMHAFLLLQQKWQNKLFFNIEPFKSCISARSHRKNCGIFSTQGWFSSLSWLSRCLFPFQRQYPPPAFPQIQVGFATPPIQSHAIWFMLSSTDMLITSSITQFCYSRGISMAHSQELAIRHWDLKLLKTENVIKMFKDLGFLPIHLPIPLVSPMHQVCWATCFTHWEL